MIIGAATVGIFLGSEMGAFDSNPAQAGETGPPSAAAPPHGAGDTLSRADAMAKVQAQAQGLVDENIDSLGAEAGRAAAIAALLREAKAASSRDAAAVFLRMALSLNPNDATATRLMRALEATATLSPAGTAAALGGKFLLADGAVVAGVTGVAADGSETTSGPEGASTFDSALGDAALRGADSPSSGLGPAGEGVVSSIADTGEGADTAAEVDPSSDTAGQPPVPIPTATPASDVQ